jgi:hypothetical protein
MIANSGYDEHGKYSGGTAGDQTGKEWRIIPYYNRPWNCVLRHPDTSVRELIAQLAEEGANNDLIGYDQYERWTFWNQLKTVGYHPKNIKTKCEADCSAGVISIVWAVGHLLGLYRLKELDATYTGNMRQGFKDAGFIVLQESKFLTSDSWLMRGDVLLNDAHHTAINLTTGKNVIVEDDDMTEAEVIQIVKNVLAGYNTEPSKWAEDEDTINKAKALGITVDGQRPQGYAKREEVFQMLIRMAERLGIKT